MQYTLWFILALVTLSGAQSTGQCPNDDDHNCSRCSSHDDPHIVTLDGLRYDQHTDGCFKYVAPCSTNTAATYLPFEVCGCHEPCGSSGHGEGCPSNIRCIRDLSIKFFDTAGSPDYEISIDADNAGDPAEDVALATDLASGTIYPFAVDHTFVYTQTGTVHEFVVESGTVAGLDFFAHIRYSPGNLEIFLSETYFTDISCGLCGLFDNDPSNDFTNATGAVVLLPSAIPYGPIDAATNTLINSFANSYLCNGSPVPADYGCEPTEADKECFLDMIDCCEALWNKLFVGGLSWDNDFVNETEFRENWLENCALDACALTLNAVDCDNKGDEFDYAIAIVKDTATAVYTTTPDDDEFASNCTAKVCAHGDNRMQLDVSYDSGSNWDLAVASEGDWKQTMTATINPVDENTVLRFTVTDVSHVGGFIATVQLCGTNGYTFEFYTNEINTYFDVISDSAGDPLLDEFTEFGGNPWGGHVNENKVACMNEKADWMWNDKNLNTMVFELFFGHHLDILRRLDCVEEETPAPTVDCCTAFSSVSDYLDVCYCPEQTTAPPTLPPIHVSVSADTLRDASSVRAQSIGVHRMHGEDAADNVFRRKLNAEMKEIKDMIYATWILIFACFVIHISIVNGCVCSKNKAMQFKSVHESDDDDIDIVDAECL